jgi:hypothetical protein
MKGSLLFFIIFSSASARTSLESIPFGFYEKLKNSANRQCSIDVNILLDGMENLNKWALESLFYFKYLIRLFMVYHIISNFAACFTISVIDSSAKLPSGILRGNLNQYGDFDECINANDNNGMAGKYCLAAIQLKQPVFSDQISAYHQVRNNLTDVSYRCIRSTSMCYN